MQRYRDIDKTILNFILEKDIPYDKVEDVFYELYLINPHSSDATLSEFTLYPKIFFHSNDVCKSMIDSFESLLKSDEKSLRKRFRAFLALIYLKGMKEKGFYGYKQLLKIKENQEPYNLANEVFHSEDFKATFLKADKSLAQKDYFSNLK